MSISVIQKPKTWARGSKPHIPTDEQRIKVLAYATVGTPHTDIAVLIGISLKTLLKRYRKELAMGKAQGNAQMGGRLFKAGMTGNIAAMIFWMKAQAGWREVQVLAGDRDNPLQFEAVARVIEAVSPEEAERAYLRLISE